MILNYVLMLSDIYCMGYDIINAFNIDNHQLEIIIDWITWLQQNLTTNYP